jgi:hypothetical protein
MNPHPGVELLKKIFPCEKVEEYLTKNRRYWRTNQ